MIYLGVTDTAKLGNEVDKAFGDWGSRTNAKRVTMTRTRAMGKYQKGDHIKFEVKDERSSESEWMWLLRLCFDVCTFSR
jgi:hypothetical protein